MIGRTLGPYEVVAKLGEGGMGEVWQARDTRLDRLVAIKVAAGRFSDRFEREARAIAALNHPNICTLYDVGPDYLVMELVDGVTLAERLAGLQATRLDSAQTTGLPLPEALQIARQVAEALEAAHDKGIVHRDLKPANIKITPDGLVKVLDFGLAKATHVDRPEAGSEPGGLLTVTSPARTEVGLILGTAAYMAPEQAAGRPIDKRADIWAFGVVLYEMLTGRRLFGGDTVSETLASVIKDDVRFDRLPAGVPRSVRRLLARCLLREPRLRLRDIGEARVLLSDPAAHDDVVVVHDSVSPSRRLIAAVGAASIGLAAAVGAAAWWLKPVPELPLRRFELPDVARASSSNGVALSPDGSRIAYVADGRLFVRAFDAAEPRDLGPVHVTSSYTFWSPDGQTIGFTAAGAIHKIAAAGGPIVEVCRIPATGTAISLAWRRDDTIVFAVWRESLYRVPAAGGTPALVLAVDPKTEIDFHSVAELPDDRLIVTTHLRADQETYRLELLGSPPGASRTEIPSDRTIVRAAVDPAGYLVLHRIGANAGVWAVSFDRAGVDLAKSTLIAPGASAVRVADDGTMALALSPAENLSELVWVDRPGGVSRVAGASFTRPTGGRGGGGMPSISPDGRRAAFFGDAESRPALIVRDLESGADVRLTFPAPIGGANAPVPFPPSWSPTGEELIFTIGRVEATEVVARRSDGSDSQRALTRGALGRMSADGRYLIFVVDERGARRLRRAALGPDGSLGPVEPVFRDADFQVSTFDVSPDGTLVAFGVEGADGQINVLLAPFPDGGRRWQVTTTGGTRPKFSRDGKELFYLAGARDGPGPPRALLMSMPLTLAPALKLGTPVTLLEEGPATRGLSLAAYDVARDGRLLMLRSVASESPGTPRLVVIQNWRALMRR